MDCCNQNQSGEALLSRPNELQFSTSITVDLSTMTHIDEPSSVV